MQNEIHPRPKLVHPALSRTVRNQLFNNKHGLNRLKVSSPSRNTSFDFHLAEGQRPLLFSSRQIYHKTLQKQFVFLWA